MNTSLKQQRKTQIKKEVFSKKLGKNQLIPFKVGDILKMKVDALGPNNLGLCELSSGYTIVVPRVSLGDEVRVIIERVVLGKPNYGIGKALEILKTKTGAVSSFNNTTKEEKIRCGEIFDVTISKPGPKGSGLVELSNQSIIVVPKTKVGDTVKIQLTRVKEDYAFAKVIDSTSFSKKNNENVLVSSKTNSLQNRQFPLILPKTAKLYRGYTVVKFNGLVVFIKMNLGAKPGDTIRAQMMKVGSNYAVAKIIKVSPLTKLQKQMHTKIRVQKMIQTGMHFGEKAIRCHANMRKYLWYRKKGNNQNRPFLKKDRYYINVLKTRRCLKKSLTQLAKYAAKGKTFLFVGTKKSASALIARTALFARTSFFVNTRWLGGMLTNWKTILKSISQIKPILKEKQKIIHNILEKRRKIKSRFIKKVNLLRKRSQKLMTKGKALITKMKQNKTSFIQRSQLLLQKRQEILVKNQLFIQKYIELKSKKKQLIEQSQRLLQRGKLVIYQKEALLKQFKTNQTKIKEFKQLFLIGQEFLKLQKNANDQGQKVWTVSYKQLNQFESQTSGTHSWAIPNPPKQILNRMIQLMKISYENSSGLATNFSTTESVNKDTVTKNRSKLESKTQDLTTGSLVLSQFISKFTSFLPFMKIYIENLILRQQNLQLLLKKTQQNIETIHQQLKVLKIFSGKLNTQLSTIKTRLLDQQQTLRTLKSKLKRLASEQRLLKFLPRLRYLTTPKVKMIQTVQTLMKKFVDPKMIVPMEQIYDDKFKFTSKKIASTRKQKWQRLEKYFGGITKMAKMNKKQISNNIAIIVGQQEEMNAVRECQKLGIKMFTLVDTNCNPKLSNHIIPVNDDSRNSVKFVLQDMLTHIRLAQKLRQKIYASKVRK